jgi:hypothetical protein
MANAKSEYEKLIAKGMVHSRKRSTTLTDEERAERRRASSRLAMEARRRATAVLVARHRDDYDTLYDKERKVLERDPRYKIGV